MEIEGYNFDEVMNNNDKKKHIEDLYSGIPAYIYLDQDDKDKFFKKLNNNYFSHYKVNKKIVKK